MPNSKKYKIANAIKVNRLHKNITLTELSAKTGITQSRISKIEREIESVTEETLQKIEAGLSVKIERFGESIPVINEIYYDFLQRLFDDDDYAYVYANNMVPQNQLMKSNDFYKILICEYILAVNQGLNKACDDLEKMLNQLILDKISAQIYCQYTGYRQFTLGNIDAAIEIYHKALTMGYQPQIHGMLYYHLALAYKSKNQLIEMYKSLTLAKQFFLENMSYRRVIYCDMNMATVYARLGATEEALAVYHTCVKMMSSLNISYSLKAMAHRNIAWIYIKNKNYSEAIEELKIAEQLKPNNQLTILYNVWCYYMLGNTKMTDKWVKKGDKLIKDYMPEYHLIKSIYKSKNTTANLKRIISDCENVIESLKKTQDLELISFYEDILIELHVMNNDYKNAFLIQKEQINRNNR